MATVALDRISKHYDATSEPAVDGVTLDIAHGEFMVFLGPSGCGKSTTLRMIAGLESISAGTLTIGDRRMNDIPARDRDIAMVFQSYALYPHMKVRDNLAFGLRRRNVADAEIARRVSDVAETLGLTPYLDRKPHALSGGQRQRVAVGRAIVRNPQVFLFDEPLSNLDAALRVSTRGELARLHQSLQATMIYVTHDQVEAMTLGSRICIMNKGRVAQIGAPLEVYRNPADCFVAGFLGNPPMNLFAATLETGMGTPATRLGPVAVPLPRIRGNAVAHGTPIIFGIRPEDIYEDPASIASRASVALSGRVSAVEQLGAETLVLIACPQLERDLILRGSRETLARRGDAITVFLDLSAAHVFDAASSKSLTMATPIQSAPLQ